MSEEFPYTKPDGSDASMFIQWKGTNICMDFHCLVCDRSSHIDADFTYFVRCKCGQVYQMGTQVIAKKVDDPGKSVVIDLPHEWEMSDLDD